MKRLFLFLALVQIMLSLQANTRNNPTAYRLQLNTQPTLTLSQNNEQQQARQMTIEANREMKRLLSEPLSLGTSAEAKEKKRWHPDVSLFRQRTNPGVIPYKFMDDMTFVGVPIFIAGIAIKGDKASFRQNYKDEFHPNTRLITNFKTSIDDYTQYFGPAMTIGLKLGGYEGRSDWPRLLASAAMSYGTMAILVNGIKYTSKEMRPDGSTANSWPSGHTATSFVGATILHKEYGLTRSPWFSIAGYGVATATGIMRVLNNRHWVSDVLSGAGIGIFSGELGYALSDVFFKGKGLLRGDLPETSSSPSFFSISMGFGLGNHNLNFGVEDLVSEADKEDFKNISTGEYENLDLSVTFRPATTVDVEGAYFFNKYVGIGGRLRVRAMSAKQWGDFAEKTRKHNVSLGQGLLYYYQQSNPTLTPEELALKTQKVQNELLGSQPLIATEEISIESDHLTEFLGSAGLYFNIPLGKRFSLGTKVLFGTSRTQELDVDAHFTGDKKNMEYQAVITHEGIKSLDITKLESTGQTYDSRWNYITLGTKNSTSYGTGLSLTYRYKANFSWRIFADYDYTEKRFQLKYDPYHYMKEGVPTLEALFVSMGTNLTPYEFEKKKQLHHFTLGGSLVVNL